MSTLDDAATYIADRFGPNYRTWETLEDDDKSRTLVSANDIISRLPFIDGVDPTTNQDIIDAGFELAVQINADPDLPNKLDQGSNIASVQGGGGVGVSYFAPTSAALGTATLLPVVVQRLVGRYLAMPDDPGSMGGSGKGFSAFARGRQFTLSWPEE
jgi:hypothetical protein